jgi:outer membrane protein assembly factor BamB
MWTTAIGGAAITEIRSIRENAGKLFATGWSNDSVGIATDSSSLSGPYDAFVLCFDLETGQKLWGRYIGGDQKDGGRDLTFDTAGNIYVAGVSTSSNGIATDTTLGNSNCFVMKLDSTGNTVWGTYASYPGIGEIRALRRLSDGTLVICGVDFFPASACTIPTNAMGSGFLTALSPDDGSTLWSTSYGDDYYDADIAPDQSILVVGKTARVGPFATDGSWNHGKYEISLSSFSPQGVMQWTTLLGGSEDDNPGSIEIRDNGEIYLVGFTHSDDIKSIEPCPTKPGHTGYTAVFTPQGRVRWASYLPFKSTLAIQIDANGNAVIPGEDSLFHLHIIALDVTSGVLGTSALPEHVPSSISLGNPYPNPAASVCTLPLELSSDRSLTISIVDVLGRSVFEQMHHDLTQGLHHIPLRVDALPRGIYRVLVKEDAGIAQTSIIVQR